MTVVKFKLHRGQKIVFDSIRNNNQKYFVYASPRQSGKTTLALTTAIYWAGLKKNTVIFWILPFYNSASNIFKQKILPMISQLKKMGILKSFDRSVGNQSITFRNGSRIEFKSSENHTSLRGNSVGYIILDEAAYHRPESWETSISPMISRRKNSAVLFISTPHGKNQFHEFYERGLNEEMYEWFSYRGSAQDTGDEKYLAFIEEQRKILPDLIFRTEYNAEFVSDSGQVFKNIENIKIGNKYFEQTNINFIGVDIGESNDRTVITIINERCELVYLKRFEIHEQNFNNIVNEISNTCKRFKGVTGFIEKNFNSFVAKKVFEENKDIYEFHTNVSNKGEMITRLNTLIALSKLKIPEIIETEELFKEMNNYEIKVSGNNYKYSAASGYHDDCIMSLAIALEAWYNYTNPTL